MGLSLFFSCPSQSLSFRCFSFAWSSALCCICSSAIFFSSSSTREFIVLLLCVRCSLPSSSGLWLFPDVRLFLSRSLLPFTYSILWCCLSLLWVRHFPFSFLSCLAFSWSSWASAPLLHSPLGCPTLTCTSLLFWSSLSLLFYTISALLLRSRLFGALVGSEVCFGIFHCLFSASGTLLCYSGSLVLFL